MPFITQGKTNLKYILIVVILAAIVGGGILAYQYLLAPKKEIKPPEVKTPEEILLPEEKEKRELIARGIHPDPVMIKVLGVNAQWEDNTVSYNLEKTYLTPDIADLGPIRENRTWKDKGFLVFQLSIRDRRTEGDRRLIPAGNYLRLRKEGKDSSPVIADYLYLSPYENGIVYVTFLVEKTERTFTLLAGILAAPRVINLDFEAEEAESIQGVFLMEEGFAPEYKSK